MNDGLPFLFYETARALSLNVNYTDGSLPESETDPDQSAAMISEVIRNVVGLGSPGGWDYPVDPRRLAFANQLAMDAEMFVMAHELAHLLLLHPQSLVPAGPAGEAIRRQRELDADSLGLLLMTYETVESEYSERFRFEYAAADFALKAIQMVAVVTNGGREPSSQTHPTVAARLEKLHAWGRGLCVDDESFLSLSAIPNVVERTLREATAPFLADV
jgi:hypothetical protein